MNITFKNLSIDFTQQDVDFSGEALLTIPSEYVEQFADDCTNCEYGQDNFNELTEAQEEAQEEGEEYEFQEMEITNTDLQIIFMNWAYSQEGTISFQYEGDNVFWLYHDFHHAIHDVTGTDIYVDGHIEAERCYQAINLLKERNEMHNINIEMLVKMQQEFEQRGEVQSSFTGAFDIQKAFELADFEEEIVDHCTMCGCESEAEELTAEQKEEHNADENETHICTECEYIGEENEFKYNETQMLMEQY